MQQLSRQHLPQSDQELLNGILQKSPEELTQDEIAVLNARRAYLTYPERQAYKGLVTDDVESQAAAAPQQPTQYTDPNVPQEPTGPQPPQAEELVNQQEQENEDMVIPAEAQGDVELTPQEQNEAAAETTTEQVSVPAAPATPAEPTTTATNPEGADQATNTTEANPYDVEDTSTLT